MARVWIFQQPRDRNKLGDKAPWSVGWYEGDRRRSKKLGTKTAARDYATRLEASMNVDEFSGLVPITWEKAKAEYLADKLGVRRPGTRTQAEIAFRHVDRILAPKKPGDLTRQALAKFARERSEEKRSGRQISPATVNKDLRQIRAFLRECVERHYVHKCPKIPFVKEPDRIPTYVTPEEFGKIYAACDVATEPAEQGFTAPDWWRAYLIFLYLTGWRAMEPLSLTKEDVDWDNQRVFLKAEHNKGGRDELIPLHPVIIEHLERIKSFGPMLIPWELPRRKLWDIFHKIQKKAKVKRRDGKPFGFHDLRRGFASMNADRMSADALQAIMRHRDYGTTKRYINIARQMNPAVRDIFVPDLPKREGGAG